MITRNVLILGASGMLGSALVKYFAEDDAFRVFGTFRFDEKSSRACPAGNYNKIFCVNGLDYSQLDLAFKQSRPDVVINCIGLVKQVPHANDRILAIELNALLPHRLVELCEMHNARLVHISTDCVFSGNKGSYTEDDHPDALDLYGRSKHLGEVNYSNSITLRTSIIGHELASSRGLIDWFLTQDREVRGFSKAVFSGLPTNELGNVIQFFVLPFPDLHGIYHVSAEPIDKYQLLSLVKNVYQKHISIKTDDSIVINRSLDSTRFRNATGFLPKSWPELIQSMYDFG